MAGRFSGPGGRLLPIRHGVSGFATKFVYSLALFGSDIDHMNVSNFSEKGHCDPGTRTGTRAQPCIILKRRAPSSVAISFAFREAPPPAPPAPSAHRRHSPLPYEPCIRTRLSCCLLPGPKATRTTLQPEAGEQAGGVRTRAPVRKHCLTAQQRRRHPPQSPFSSARATPTATCARERRARVGLRRAPPSGGASSVVPTEGRVHRRPPATAEKGARRSPTAEGRVRASSSVAPRGARVVVRHY